PVLVRDLDRAPDRGAPLRGLALARATPEPHGREAAAADHVRAHAAARELGLEVERALDARHAVVGDDQQRRGREPPALLEPGDEARERRLLLAQGLRRLPRARAVAVPGAVRAAEPGGHEARRIGAVQPVEDAVDLAPRGRARIEALPLARAGAVAPGALGADPVV